MRCQNLLLYNILLQSDLHMTKHYLHVQDSIRMDAVDRFSPAFPISNAADSSDVR